jgi:hypothetical protein
LYYHIAKYGEDLCRPFLFGLTIIILSIIVYWLIEPNSVKYTGLSPIGNAFHIGLNSTCEEGAL